LLIEAAGTPQLPKDIKSRAADAPALHPSRRVACGIHAAGFHDVAAIADGRLEEALKIPMPAGTPPPGRTVVDGRMTLGELADRVLAHNADTTPVSHRQGYFENLSIDFVAHDAMATT